MFKINFAYDGIRTADLCGQKQLLCEMNHNHCPCLCIALFQQEIFLPSAGIKQVGGSEKIECFIL